MFAGIGMATGNTEMMMASSLNNRGSNKKRTLSKNDKAKLQKVQKDRIEKHRAELALDRQRKQQKGVLTSDKKAVLETLVSVIKAKDKTQANAVGAYYTSSGLPGMGSTKKKKAAIEAVQNYNLSIKKLRQQEKSYGIPLNTYAPNAIQMKSFVGRGDKKITVNTYGGRKRRRTRRKRRKSRRKRRKSRRKRRKSRRKRRR